MLNDLKKYIIEQELDDQVRLVRSVFAKTKDEKLLNYFVDSTRQRVWECEQRAWEILYSYYYDYILTEDVFIDAPFGAYGKEYDIGSPNLFMLLYLHCFFEKDEIIVVLISGTTVDCCDEILSCNRERITFTNGEFFRNIFKVLDKDFSSYFELEKNEYLISKYCEVSEETGEPDIATYECETYGFILMIRLVNRKKIKLFKKIMNSLGFEVVKTEAYTFELESYGGYTQSSSLHYCIEHLDDMNELRSIDHIVDATVPYSNENIAILMRESIDGLIGYKYSSKEILL
ncbi:MAG: hypothetical protein RR945_02030 [Erysipelotrichaceae bacterium]